jgi:hypothetical protein
VGRGPAARAEDAAPVGGARGRDARRQVSPSRAPHGKDDDHLAAHRGAAALRRRPVLRDRRDLNESGYPTPTTGRGGSSSRGRRGDGAFLVYSPYGALVTTWRPTTSTTTGTEEAYRAAFTSSLDRSTATASWSAASTTRRAAPAPSAAAGGSTWSVGGVRDADLRADGPALRRLHVDVHGARAARRSARSAADPGRHYVLDALAALAAGCGSGFRSTTCAGARGFTGTGRRMELKGEAGGVRVYDSYAHHPPRSPATCRRRALAAGGPRRRAPSSRTWSPAPDLRPAMGRALGAADEVVVLDVYVAREDADPASPAAGRRRRPAAAERGAFVADSTARPPSCRPGPPGDLVLTLGAGDVTASARGARAACGRRREARRPPATPDRPRRAATAVAASGSPAGSGRAAGCLALASARAGSCAARRRRLARVFSAVLPCSGVEVAGARPCAPRSGAAACPTASRWPASTSTRSARGRGAAARASSTSPRSGPTRADRVDGAAPSRSSRSAAAPRPGRRRRGLPRLRTAPAGLPAISRPPPPARRAREAADVVAALPGELARRSTTSRCAPSTRSPCVLRDGRTCCGGARRLRAQGRGARRCSQPGQRYDVTSRPADHLRD